MNNSKKMLIVNGVLFCVLIVCHLFVAKLHLASTVDTYLLKDCSQTLNNQLSKLSSQNKPHPDFQELLRLHAIRDQLAEQYEIN